ncbi:MAG: hypothetical protein A2Z15_02640 [Chloroflexi bacterium RBG_16_50_11]|nr:MAG: hypothetical protein A2Z15_02640 [Chloroflexi bacterium RBG_16_50_11]
MPKTKYGKYIISELKMPKVEAAWSPPNLGPAGKGRGGRVLYLDSDVMPGAFYMECVWVMPRPANAAPPPGGRRVGTEPHAHDYDEIIAFFGSDPNDPYNLNAEVELWLGDEKHTITKTSLVFIPAGLKHCPLTFLRVDKPVFHYTTGPGKMYF